MKNRKATAVARPPASRIGAALASAFCAALLVLATVAAFAETPEKYDQGQAAIGRSLFNGYCTSCHGREAKGDGAIAEYLVVPPADLTRIEGENGEFPFERVVKKIDGREKVPAHGSSEMPIWGDVFQKAESGGDESVVKSKITALAHYVWSLQADAEEDDG